LSGVSALARRHFDDSLNSVASGLGLVADDRNFFADERIQQRRFACIGTAEDGDETGAHTPV
jgi:hypothetical protein